MNVLIADDRESNQKLLMALLSWQGYEVELARDGGEALAALRKATGPLVALVDWEMPVMAGIDVCREIRKEPKAELFFLILVTVRDRTKDIVAGLEAGANDYITKPFDNAELLARVGVGARYIEMQQKLRARLKELEAAMAEVKQLKGLLPICSYCKKIRDDRNYWQEVESYIVSRTNAEFSHGYCPECFQKHLGPEFEKLGFSAQEVAGMYPSDKLPRSDGPAGESGPQ